MDPARIGRKFADVNRALMKQSIAARRIAPGGTLGTCAPLHL